MLYDLAKKKFIVSLIIAVVLYFFNFGFLAFIVLAYSLGVLYLYRQSKRYNLFNEKAIHIPVDGRIVSIEKLKDSICISIENGICDLGSILAPINSDDVKVNKINGLNYSLFTRHANTLNEKIHFDFNKDGHTIKMTAICNFMPNSLYKYRFETVNNGDILGHTISGLVNIYVPNTCILKVDIGDNVKARGILGYF